MVKELKLLSPEVWDRCFTRNDGKCNKEKYRVLHVPGDYTYEELENDINAGAAHFKPCMDYINGEQSNMIVILCDTEEEGLNAVTYLAAAAGMEYTDSEAGDEDYEECCDFEYDNNIGSFSGAQLKGQFVGQTAPKVHQIFEDHDIILIDEPYPLTASDGVGMDTYSQEALAQLAIELENHGKDRLMQANSNQ